MNGFDEEAARAITLGPLANRAADATVCPSEVARAWAGQTAGGEWRMAMPIVHAAVDGLLRSGAVRVTWKGKALTSRSGPYRIAANGAFSES